jgi:glycerophosphoryl diester phosphodiesterase
MLRPRIFGHRGASGEAPENTLRAFALAAQQGADGIELDVQPCADGTLMIMHDETVDRTTNGRGRVADLSAAQLAALDAGGEPVPTLTAALMLARGRLFVDIEIKDPGIEPAIAALVAQLDMADQVAISSFYPASLAAMRQAAPHLPRWLLSVTWQVPQWAAAAALAAVGIAPRFPAIEPALVERARADGLAVIAWTVNQPAEIERLIGLGIDAIISDYPRRVLAAGAA